jgi:hypothetical protein
MINGRIIKEQQRKAPRELTIADGVAEIIYFLPNSQ